LSIGPVLIPNVTEVLRASCEPLRVMVAPAVQTARWHLETDLTIDVINVYNVYKKFFVNAFIILSTFISTRKPSYR